MEENKEQKQDIKQKSYYRTNKFWVVLFGSVVLLSAIGVLLLNRVPVSYARIYRDGDLIETVDLTAVTEPFKISIIDGVGDVDANDNGSDTKSSYMLEVDHGRIRVSAADCPDLICFHQGWRSGGMLPIVCLPNRIVVTFEGRSSDDVDAVVG